MDSLAWSFVLNSGGLYVAMIYAVLVLSQHFWQTNQGLQTQGWGGGGQGIAALYFFEIWMINKETQI